MYNGKDKSTTSYRNTGPLTKCFQCHLLGHYHEDCPSYTCPHCHLSTPGHLPPLVFDTNVASVITGDIVIDSVPTAPVEFAIPLGTSLMLVQLNIFPPCSRPRSLEVPRSVTTRGLVIEPGAQLYKRGNVMICPYPFIGGAVLMIVAEKMTLKTFG